MNEEGIRETQAGARSVGLILLLAAAWIALQPWRPVLTGDDFGYYDSVVRTLVEGRVVVSDWLNPFAVGMTVPATGLVKLTGDLWLGSMLTVGVFGLVGLWAFGRLLQVFGQAPAPARRGVLVWAFFPAWLAKWTHFESAVPATSLMLLSLLCYFRAERHPGRGSGWMLLAGGAWAAWAVAIRQNHVVLVGVGALGLLAGGREGRLARLALWSAIPAMVFLFLQHGMPKTFAQEHVLNWHLSRLGPWEYAGRLLRGTCFAVGCAGGLWLLSDPTGTLARLRQGATWQWWLGGVSLVMLLGAAFFSGAAIRWLAPQSDVLYLARFPWLLAGVTSVGALTWPLCFPPRGLRTGHWVVGLLVANAGYVALTSLWGYWEYYFLEVILLIWLVLVQSRPATVVAVASRSWGITQVFAVACYVGAAWYGQRTLTDLQAAQVTVLEQAFRDKLVDPAHCDGAPFGLVGWSLFPAHAATWQPGRGASPLGFTRNRQLTAHFRWRDAAGENSKILRQGTARVGFWPRPWVLFTDKCAQPALDATSAHRLLPVTRLEWQAYLVRDRESTSDAGVSRVND